MRFGRYSKFASVAAFLCTLALSGGNADGKSGVPGSYAPPNDAPNPYQTVHDWAQFPDGRKWGSTAGVAVSPEGNIWAYDRCGANACDASPLNPILEFDTSGKLLKSFGAGIFVMPHGFYVDRQGNVWVTDAMGRGGKGQQVVKFSPDGKELMRLGKAGEAGDGPDMFNQPGAVAVAKNGDIFVADGHAPTCGSSRIVKFSKEGKFIKAFGKKGDGPEDLMCPHSLAFDSKGRLFVADRSHNRVVIMDQNGKFLGSWKQFGRPSGIFIDAHDILYVTDSESKDKIEPSPGGVGPVGYGYNPGCMRGIRIGSVKDGKVTAFIPDPAPTGGTSISEGVAADHQGNVYGAEVGPKDMKKYVKKS
jgi:DNA-binding beta-propeller fold protein YncE